MMKTIKDFLIVDTQRYGKPKEHEEIRFAVEIQEIKENPFYLEFDDKTRHWEFRITPTFQYDEGEGEHWHRDERQTLRFKMSQYTQPTLEQFSEHIKMELTALLRAMSNVRGYVWDIVQDLYSPFRDNFTPEVVYAFLKEIHKDYTKTEDFLRDYEHYHNRMYHDLKFLMYMIEGNRAMFSMSYDYPIGEHMLAFLDLEEFKYCDYYEKA